MITSDSVECKGNGLCLGANFYICKFKCKPVSCSNYHICRNELPQYELDFNKGVCWVCVMNFSPKGNNSPILKFKPNIECVICFETNKIGVRNLRCNHFVCEDCFKNIYCDQLDEAKEPAFPYEDDIIYQMYVEEPCLFQLDEQIQEWKNQMKVYSENKMIEDVYKKRCPFCRK